MILIVKELRLTPWLIPHIEYIIMCLNDYSRYLCNYEVEVMFIDAYVIAHLKKGV